MKYANGHTTAIPSPKLSGKSVWGRSIAHKNLSKRQRACLAANWVDGRLGFKPTMRQAAHDFGVSTAYAHRAHKLSPERRDAIVEGRDTFTKLVEPKPVSALPSNGSKGAITDLELEHAVRAAGVERTLTIAAKVDAATVEHHQAA